LAQKNTAQSLTNRFAKLRDWFRIAGPPGHDGRKNPRISIDGHAAQLMTSLFMSDARWCKTMIFCVQVAAQ
jgi:hypothetical protein